MARKEVRPVQTEQACDVCGRSMLKGESREPWLAPGGERRMVCELCPPVAARQGWVRESAAGEVPISTRRPEARRSLLSRFRPRADREGADAPPAEAGWGEPPAGFGAPGEEQAPAPADG